MSDNNWISLNIPDDALDSIIKVINSLETRLKQFKGYKKEDLHMTFFYMGKHLQTMPKEELEKFKDYMKLYDNQNYCLDSSSISYYPEPKGKNLVILFKGDEQLMEDNKRFENEMNKRGYTCYPFIPHITIGKVISKRRIPFNIPKIDISYISNSLNIDGKKIDITSL